MVHQATRFSDAHSAWQNWNLTDFESKYQNLLSFKQAIQKDNSELAPVIHYHLEQAKTLLAESHQLTGPTGETNELYTAGRGVAVVIQDESTQQAKLSVLAQLTAAVIAGNSVILCSDDEILAPLVKQAFDDSSLPTNLVQLVSLDAYQALLESDVRSIGYVGNTQVELSLNRQLSMRTGAIASFVSETDLVNLPNAHDPHLSLRFITERTRTINITAVGGNATLLELGSEAH